MSCIVYRESWAASFTRGFRAPSPQSREDNPTQNNCSPALADGPLNACISTPAVASTPAGTRRHTHAKEEVTVIGNKMLSVWQDVWEGFSARCREAARGRCYRWRQAAAEGLRQPWRRAGFQWGGQDGGTCCCRAPTAPARLLVRNQKPGTWSPWWRAPPHTGPPQRPGGGLCLPEEKRTKPTCTHCSILQSLMIDLIRKWSLYAVSLYIYRYPRLLGQAKDID